jgi:hypothetical protein
LSTVKAAIVADIVDGRSQIAKGAPCDVRLWDGAAALSALLLVLIVLGRFRVDLVRRRKIP